VDADGTVLDILVQDRQDTAAARRFFRKLLKKTRTMPRVIVGVNPETLRNWIRAAGAGHGRGRTEGAPAVPGSSVEAELAAARKRIRDLEEERDILRKAARYFAAETGW
jgi:transposase